MTTALDLPLTVRQLTAEDLPELDWTGGPEHLRAVADLVQLCWAEEASSLVVALPNGRLVAHGAVDFRAAGDYAELWMLSVHPLLQSLGLGTLLVRALEAVVSRRGRVTARLSKSAPPAGRTVVREDSGALAVAGGGCRLDPGHVRRGRPRSHSGACEPVVEHGGGGRPREPWIGAMSPSVRLPLSPCPPHGGRLERSAGGKESWKWK